MGNLCLSCSKPPEFVYTPYGLRRFVPEELVSADVREQALRVRTPRPITLVWTLLDDRDAEAIRAEVRAGRHRAACGLLLNRAVELIPLRAAIPRP